MFLDKIESLYGEARRVWLMDRGIPTEGPRPNSVAEAGRMLKKLWGRLVDLSASPHIS